MQAIHANDPLLEGKADFLLAACVSNSCEFPLRPTLDAEFLATGRLFSSDAMAPLPGTVSAPVLITRAVHELCPFESIQILNLGLIKAPQQCRLMDFGLLPTPGISDATPFDAKTVFEKGFAFGKRYRLEGDYLILAESVPSGTTTALASISALGYETTSFLENAADAIMIETIKKSLAKLHSNMGLFEKLGHTADNMLLFCAGFILSASRRFKLVLAGGTPMAAVLLIANKIAGLQGIHHDHRRIHLCTTKRTHSDIQALIRQLDFRLKAYYADFSFETSSHPLLREYETGEAKEQAGAGAAIAYAYAHGISAKRLTEKTEGYLS